MLENEPSGEPAGAPAPSDAGTPTTTTSATQDSTVDAASADAPSVARRTRKRAAKAARTDESASADAPDGPAGRTSTRGAATARRRAVAEPTVEATPQPVQSDNTGASMQNAVEAVGRDRGQPVDADPAVRPAAPMSVLFMPPVESDFRTASGAARPGGAPGSPGDDGSRERTGRAGDALPATEGEAGRPTRRRRGRRSAETEPAPAPAAEADEAADSRDAADAGGDVTPTEDDTSADRGRRRGRRGRGRGKGAADEGEATVTEAAEAAEATEAEAGDEAGEEETGEGGLTRRRRRRRRKGTAESEAPADEPHVVVKIREPRSGRDEVQGVSGSTRLEAKRQRRRDGREQRRTRPPVLSEAEFLARREAVDRVMVVRQKVDRTQIGVLEDGVLVEHYVTRASAATMVGNVYLGRVQNVLPSMEAAFVDIGRGRNAVLYAGEVNWDTTGLEGRTRTIEQALKPGDAVLVQVTKDPVGTKGARLTSHIALSGRHLVYVPHGNASGISRKLSDVERRRLRDVLKNLLPDGAGVIVRTAAEGATEDELARDVKRLQAQWDDIQAKAAAGNAPALLYQEPDLVIRVVRDLFNEDFRELVIQGTEAYDLVEPYLSHVSPDLVGRLRRYTGTGDVFADLRVDEQLLKGLDRKVFLPSGGHLVIDRTEAMTVIDVNTGKYTGAGGNLEETVTRNNLEAAEEIVRQLRLRDVGGIIVIDFIDMVLESNRELVLRRLTECLGRDRTKHQVTEITSLGLVQMTRKRVGQGLLEAFSETCEYCKGRGLIIHPEPVADRRGDRSGLAKVAAASAGDSGRDGRRRGRRGAVAVAEEPATDLGGSDLNDVEVVGVSDLGDLDEVTDSDADVGTDADLDDIDVVLDAEIGDGEPADPELVDSIFVGAPLEVDPELTDGPERDRQRRGRGGRARR